MPFPDDVIRNLVAYARTQTGISLNELCAAVLDRAYDAHGIEDDDVWSAVRAQLDELARAQPAQPAWEHSDLVTAPYRFVPLNKSVALVEQPPTALDKPGPGHLDAVLDIDWEVDTPILIGEPRNGVVEPFQLASDDWAIPGATLRGTIRATLEALAFARMFQVNRHQRFGLRDFSHDTYKKFITAGLGTPGLQAGWLSGDPDGDVGEMYIEPCGWGYVEIADLTSDAVAWVSKGKRQKYNDTNIDWYSAFTESRNFTTVGPHPNHSTRNIYRQDATGIPGHMVFSGAVPGHADGAPQKAYEYVFLACVGDRQMLNEDVATTFRTANCKPSQNKLVPDGAWKELHGTVKAGGRVPVFYLGDLDNQNADFSFGLTRLYRLPHKHSLGKLLLADSTAHRLEVDAETGMLRPDFVENLFGYVYEQKDLEFGHEAPPPGAPEDRKRKSVARRGRVAFGFARPAPGPGFHLWPDQPIPTVMGAPKPSFAPFYLVGREKDYSVDGARLAGRKRYIPRRSVDDGGNFDPHLREQLEKEGIGATGDVQSRLRFLAPEPGAAFRGRIRCHNVSPAELGGLLWAITFGGSAKCRHLLGRAKAFGAGQVRARRIRIVTRSVDKAATRRELTWTADQGRQPLADWLDPFENQIAELAGFKSVTEWRDSREVSSLLKIAEPRGWKAAGTTYLTYKVCGKQAKHFSALRTATGPGAARQIPYQLLLP